jgi:hypothetical protein
MVNPFSTALYALQKLIKGLKIFASKEGPITDQYFLLLIA